MEARTIDHEACRITQRKLRIIRLQGTAAALARKGEAERARRERAKLFKLLNELDVMEALRGGGKAA
jgi:hypothetical protein